MIYSDVEAWRAWQHSRVPWAKRARHALVPRGRGCSRSPVVTSYHESPEALVVMDSFSPTSLRALARPLAHLDRSRVAIMATEAAEHLLPGAHAQAWSSSLTENITAVVSLGDYMELGGFGREIAQARGARQLVVQHGLLTPYAPPLPAGAHLLAWSSPDAAFYCAERDDVTPAVIGSQLMWEASAHPAVGLRSDARPVYLGQLHGAEMARSSMARAATSFCLANGAVYRPHPSEKDVLSRAQHRLWRHRGMTIDDGKAPMGEIAAPVVSVFSTGVLEAAARGLPSYVWHLSPPGWLKEFWDRYDMRPWGQEPTPSPQIAEKEPAKAVAAAIEECLS